MTSTPWPLYIFPVLISLIAVPMMMGRVPPNRWYGFRTPKTFSSEQIWYEANRASGWSLFYAGLAMLLLTVIRPYVPQLQGMTLGTFLIVAHLAPLTVSLIYGFWYLNRL